MHLIGVPFDSCGKRSGSRLGPAAVRLANLSEVMADIGVELSDLGDIQLGSSEIVSAENGLKHFSQGVCCIETVKSVVSSVLTAGETPLVVGGDHFIAAGSVAAALEAFPGSIAVVWIDAHADLNTPDTSPSGNLHGMPLAALLGLRAAGGGTRKSQWDQILQIASGAAALTPGRVAWFGLRELDPAEQTRLRALKRGCSESEPAPEKPALKSHVTTMHDIDRHGLVGCIEELDRWLRNSGATQIWISFDVDVLDPILAPGTGTTVRGGLTYREMHIFGELLYEYMAQTGCPYRLAGLDLVEINPLSDTNNVTALTAVEWIASLFGKRILGRPI